MIAVMMDYYFGPIADRNKFRMHGNPNGTLEVYPDRLEIYRDAVFVREKIEKKKGPVPPLIVIPRDIVISMTRSAENRDGSFQRCSFELKDSQCLDISMRGFKVSPVNDAIIEFMEGKKQGRSANASQKASGNTAQKASGSAKTGAAYAGTKNSSTASGPEIRICPECGRRNEGTRRFCGYCGSILYNRSGKDEQNKPGGRSGQNPYNNAAMHSDKELLAVICRQADYYHQNEAYETEAAYLRGTEQQFPDNLDIKLKLGRAYRVLKRYDEAIECYDQAIYIDSESPTPYYNLGVLYANLHQYGVGLVFMEKAYNMILENIDPKYKELRAQIRAGYALCTGKCGNMDEAVKELEIAESISNNRNGFRFIREKLGILKD